MVIASMDGTMIFFDEKNSEYKEIRRWKYQCDTVTDSDKPDDMKDLIRGLQVLDTTKREEGMDKQVL